MEPSRTYTWDPEDARPISLNIGFCPTRPPSPSSGEAPLGAPSPLSGGDRLLRALPAVHSLLREEVLDRRKELVGLLGVRVVSGITDHHQPGRPK